MIFIRDFVLWMLVSLHIVGGAFLFRRIFPRESPWLGFIIPAGLLVLLCNFLEHNFALPAFPALRLFLPVTSFAAVLCIAWRKSPWRVMRLPTLLFLAAFAFTFFLRVLRPDIAMARDGIPDMSLMASFTFGQVLPVEGTWLPPVKLLHYYCLEHYGASVLTRLLGVDIGTGFNLSCALLSAYVYFLIGAVAWHLGRGKMWIVAATCALTACTATGLSAYLFFVIHDLDPEALIDPYTQHEEAEPHVPILNLPQLDYYDTHELIPSGYGSWLGCLHSVQAGQAAICFTILALVETLRRRRTNWPWICLLLGPLIMLTTCTWGVPMCGFLWFAGAYVCWRMKIAPQNPIFVVASCVALIALLEPMLVYFLNWIPPLPLGWATGLHTLPSEFFVQWWPIYLPWLAVIPAWKRLHPVTRIVLILTPLAFTAVEIWNIGERIDMTEKSWGLIYASAWIVLVPELARQTSLFPRAIFLLLAIASGMTFCYWSSYYWRVLPTEDIGRLDGRGVLRTDSKKARILETLSHLDNAIIVPGKSSWSYSECALLTQFSHNRAYVTWSLIADTIMHTNGHNEAHRREIAVNTIYAGTMADPLFYLRQGNIAAFVIYPDDEINPAVVDGLKKSLAPYYTYDDATFRGDDDVRKGLSPERPCAGVFVYHPEITQLLGPAPDKGGK